MLFYDRETIASSLQKCIQQKNKNRPQENFNSIINMKTSKENRKVWAWGKVKTLEIHFKDF